MTPEEYLDRVVDDRLFEGYWRAVETLGSTDLVMIYRMGHPTEPVAAIRREVFLTDPKAPEFCRKKFAKPALATTGLTSTAAFWLIVLSDEGVVTAAIQGQKITSTKGEMN